MFSFPEAPITQDLSRADTLPVETKVEEEPFNESKRSQSKEEACQDISKEDPGIDVTGIWKSKSELAADEEEALPTTSTRSPSIK